MRRKGSLTGCADRRPGVKWEWDRKCVGYLGSVLRLGHEGVTAWRRRSRTTVRTPPSRGVDRDQLTESSSVVSSGLGEGKGTAAGERDTNEAEGETGGRAGKSSGDIIRVNMGDGEGDEPK